MAANADYGEELVYLNGRLMPARQAMVPVSDYGFLLGYGLFETMRAYGGVVFRLKEHVERLLNSAKVLGFSRLLSVEGLETTCRDSVVANNLCEARVRLTVTPGQGPAAPDPAMCSAATVLVTARPYVPHSEAAYRKGFSAVIVPGRRCSMSGVAGVKSLSYVENIMARGEAARKGAQEALFLNESGMLAEGGITNVFIVSDGRIVTPPPGAGILSGITRRDVLVLAQRLGIETCECDVSPAELMEADEAFLTNSLMEVMPLTGVDGNVIGNGDDRPVTQRLRSGYKELVQDSVVIR